MAKSKTANSVSNRDEALNAAMAQIRKQHGTGSVMWMGERPAEKVDAIPTGSIGLDVALGVGGLPRGRVAEIYGPESSGKTTLALELIAQAQRQGEAVAFIDAEHALDPDYAASIGVSIDGEGAGGLLVSQPDTGEQALEIADTLVRSSAVGLIVVDSVAALTPKAEIEGEMGDSQVGVQARLLSQALRKLTANIAHSKTTVLFINQLREKIGVTFGSPETTTGGNALKFYCSVRLDIRRIGTIMDGDTPRGNETRVKVVKNKVAPPFKQAHFDILWDGHGISREGELIDLGVRYGVVEKSGSWFSYGGERLGQGKHKSREHLKGTPALAERIEHELWGHLDPQGKMRRRATDSVTPPQPSAVAGHTDGEVA